VEETLICFQLPPLLKAEERGRGRRGGGAKLKLPVQTLELVSRERVLPLHFERERDKEESRQDR
jgi:hypothetical protein